MAVPERNVAQMVPGEVAVVSGFTDEPLSVKLMEMGCLPGNIVELIQIAPFGDPIYLNINGAHVAIRLETASEIEVDIIQTHG